MIPNDKYKTTNTPMGRSANALDFFMVNSLSVKSQLNLRDYITYCLKRQQLFKTN